MDEHGQALMSMVYSDSIILHLERHCSTINQSCKETNTSSLATNSWKWENFALPITWLLRSRPTWLRKPRPSTRHSEWTTSSNRKAWTAIVLSPERGTEFLESGTRKMFVKTVACPFCICVYRLSNRPEETTEKKKNKKKKKNNNNNKNKKTWWW